MPAHVGAYSAREALRLQGECTPLSGLCLSVCLFGLLITRITLLCGWGWNLRLPTC